MLFRHAGAARFIYNWALARKDEIYKETGKSMSRYDLNKELTRLKQTECPWLYEVNNSILQSAIINLCRAYENWFRAIKMGISELSILNSTADSIQNKVLRCTALCMLRIRV